MARWCCTRWQLPTGVQSVAPISWICLWLKAGFGCAGSSICPGLEQSGSYLEGTGSLVLDRRTGTAFAARSARTHAAALAEFARLTGYRVVAFSASIAGQAVYHTNVLMSLGRHFAVLCSDAIVDPAERRAVCAELAATNRSLVEISAEQVRQFAANCLEVDSAGGPVLVLSETALQSLPPGQRRVLERYTALLPVDVATIEQCRWRQCALHAGGDPPAASGSARLRVRVSSTDSLQHPDP